MMPWCRVRPAMFVMQMVVVFLAMGAFRVLSDEAGREEPHVLPMSTESASEPRAHHLATTVRWKGREYDIDAGIEVLMTVVRNPDETPDERGRALAGLVVLGAQLSGRECMEELVTLYHTTGPLEKGFILLSFMTSEDHRGIALFVRVLDKERDDYLRFIAADGLARWNIRRGVAELIQLFESTELPSGRFYPLVGERARALFQKLNDRKEWGFPNEEIGKAIASRTDLNDQEKLATYVADIKRWFAENEHRFPDWKLGDPLPEVPATDENKSGEE